MRPHFARLTEAGCAPKTLGELPLLPPWMIEQIKRRKPLEERPQPRMEIDDSPPPGWKRPEKKSDETERGVVIIDFSL